MTNASVMSLNVSSRKGEKKTPVKSVEVDTSGIAGDAHSGNWHRQISLLANESVDKLRKTLPEIGPGDFAENITTRGIDLASLAVGTRLRVGGAVLEVSQIGKECHEACDIRKKVGECVMPREGIFARVLEAGTIKRGDPIAVE